MINVMMMNKDIDNLDELKDDYNIIPINSDVNIANKLKNNEIDIIILNYIPTNLELILTIKLIKKYNSNIKVVVATDIVHESIIRLLYDNGVDYILIRPLDLSLLKSFLNRITKKDNNIKEKSYSETKVIKLLNSLGMPANLKGYSYIKEAIALCYKDRDLYLHTTSKLYPTLSKIFKIKASCIEKAIRSAIELCWIRGDVDEQEKVFGYTVNKDKGRPTNGEFLAQLSNYLFSN